MKLSHLLGPVIKIKLINIDARLSNKTRTQKNGRHILKTEEGGHILKTEKGGHTLKRIGGNRIKLLLLNPPGLVVL